MSCSPGARPPGDAQEEVLRRLAVIDQKIDWIARRVVLQDQKHPESTAGTAYQASVAPSAGASSQRLEPPARSILAPAHRAPAASSVPVSAPSVPTGVSQRPEADVLRDPVARPSAPSAPTTTPVLAGTGRAGHLSLAPRAAVPATAPAAPVTPEPVHTRSEGAVGRYLLSGAAALLVVLAAVTLLALVWDSVPDLAKVGGLAALALALVTGGSALALRRPSQRVAAATLTGTGGALGFVAVVGAVLMQVGLPVVLAFILMAAWGVLLLLVSRRTEQVFTAVISAIGALVTIGFASWYTVTNPQGAALSWVLVCAYLMVLAVTTTVLARSPRQVTYSQWYPVTSMVATGFAALMTPDAVVYLESVPLASILCLVPVVVLGAQVLEAGARLHAGGHALFGVLDWLMVGLLTFVVLTRLLTTDPPGTWTGYGQRSVPVPAVMVLVVLAGVALSLLPERAPARWRYFSVTTQLTVTGALSAFIVTSYPTLFGLGALVVALSAAACSRSGSAAGVLGLGLFALTALRLHTSAVAGSLSVLVGLLTVVVATVLVERWLTDRPAVTEEASPSVDPQPAAQAKARRHVLHAATWLLAVNLVVRLPLAVVDLPDSMKILRSLTVIFALTGLLTGLAALVVTALGLFAGARTPATLLSGQMAGRLAGAGEQTRPRPPALAWIGYVLLGLLALQDLVWSSFMEPFGWRTLMVMTAAALVAAAVRCVRQWLSRPVVSLAVALLSSVCLWWSVVILTWQKPTSVLMTIVILLTGAVCIVLGFRVRATTLRHYGLALVLLAVLKLALLDIGSQSSVTRVLALLAAGTVCFALSLAYNRAANQSASASAEHSPQPGTDPVYGHVPQTPPQAPGSSE